MDIESILKQMTLEEKAALVSGTDFMYTNPIPRLGIPSLCMSDGPHGLRKQKAGGDNGITASEPATAFPTAVTTASGWNPDNLKRMGAAIGRECRHYGVHTLLGPGVNIKRNPLCGRNFEYFSEDPYLAGVMGAAEVEGVQSQGVGVSVKHFAMNNSENYRFMGNSVASENTVRNLYLKPFEYIVKHAHPATLMCAYNQINGVYCSENKWLLTDVLRKEWGFDGVVMTDWGAVHDRAAGIKAGLDLEMPGDTAICRRWILDAARDGSLPMADLDQACRNILKWIDQYAKPADETPVDWQTHHDLAGEIAADCAVLMKNDGTLPLTGKEKLHIAGALYETMRYQGSGSSMINPTQVTTVRDAFEKRNIKNHSLADCDTVLVFAGLTDEYESEGCDRENMRLPEKQLKLIDDMIATGKKVVVIGGGNVAMDAARSALRLGAETVYIVYRRGMAELPARKEEVEHAEEEGIIFKTLCNPVEILPGEDGFVRAITCIEMELGEPDASGRRRPIEKKGSEFTMDVDTVIMSLGTSPNPLIRSTTPGLETNRHGCIVTEGDEGKTSREGVYAGGDAVTGAATVIKAMGAGKAAAKAIDEYIRNK